MASEAAVGGMAAFGVTCMCVCVYILFIITVISLFLFCLSFYFNLRVLPFFLTLSPIPLELGVSEQTTVPC